LGKEAVLTIDGKRAENVQALGLRTEDMFRPFLGQCEIQAVIDSEQKDRWEQMSSLLGFGEFGAARQRLQRLRSDSDREERVVSAREISSRAIQPLTPAGEDPLALAPSELRKRASRFLGIADTESWQTILQAAESQLRELYARNLRPPSLEALVVGTPEIRSHVLRADIVAKLVVAETALHRAWHRENAFASFVSEGLALLDAATPSSCPFCGEESLTGQRLDVLRDTASRTPPKPDDHRDELRSIAFSGLGGPGPLNSDIASRLLEGLPEGPDRSSLGELLREQADLEVSRRRLVGLVEGLCAATSGAHRGAADDQGMLSLADQICDIVAQIGSSHAAVRGGADALSASLAARFTSLSEAEQKKLAGLQTAKTLAENSATIEAAWRIHELQEDLGRLVQLLEGAEKKRMAESLRRLGEDIASYYDELNPGHHIKITGVTVRDTRWRQAALEATSFGRPINPVTTFSEAEGNCLGLSLYFSQRVDRNAQWKMILLDDPVQSMDEGHEQSLVSLLARVARRRQLIVLSHNRRFAEAVQAQFSALPSFTRYDIERGADPQPRLVLTTGRLDDLLTYADRNANGDRVTRECCGAALRKAVERLGRDLAARRKLSLPKRLSAEQLIDRLHAEGLVDDIEVGTLHRLRRFGNRNAHEDVEADSCERGIRTGILSMRDLEHKYLGLQPSPLQLHLLGTDTEGQIAG
jgi:hypothetical protein